MKRRTNISWTQAAEWIAQNDDPDCFDIDAIKGLVTIAMVADLTGLSIAQISEQVLFHRQFWAQNKDAPIQRFDAGA